LVTLRGFLQLGGIATVHIAEIKATAPQFLLDGAQIVLSPHGTGTEEQDNKWEENRGPGYFHFS
jgi:hypothetical protein